jgi:hypothetical protein
MAESRVQIPLGKMTLNCSIEEIAATYSWLLLEMFAATPRLRSDEREVLRQIMTHENESLTVSDLFPEFTRESESHKTLRRLRAAQFIRPAKTGRWDPNEKIEVKPFGWLMWNQFGEDIIFGDSNGHNCACNGHNHNGGVCGNKADDAVIDLASPDVNKADDAEIDLASPVVNEVESIGPMLQADEALDAKDDDFIDLFEFAKEEARA